MSKNCKGYMGDQIGKLGPAVGSRWKGKMIYRAYQKFVHDPKSEHQQLVRARFTLLTQLGRTFYQAAKLGFFDLARQRQETEGNCFVSKNYPNVTGTTPDNVSIDPTKIMVSLGNLPGVVFSSSIGTSTPGTLTVTVTDVMSGVMDASDEDNIYVFAYCPDAGNGVLSAPARRTDGATLSVRYPSSWSGLEVHVYGFVLGGIAKTMGVASNSEYVGHAELG